MFAKPTVHVLLAAAVAAACGAVARAAPPGDDAFFETRIRPVLVRRCGACHGAQVQSGGIRIDQPLPAGVASRLAAAVRRTSRVAMPPSGPLPARETDDLARWAEAGAPWPSRTPSGSPSPPSPSEVWAYQPLRTHPVPTYPGLSPVDAFLRARRRASGLTEAPPADRRTLLRRVHHDLTGLPPTAEEIAAFLADRRPGAYERVVDRLLASTAYAERQARHWLDLVRYADTNGYERDAAKPFAWKYRDWVVRSIDRDIPYDRFVLEQLAGDELPDRTDASLVATGFLRLGTWDDEPNDPMEYQHERIDDLVHATTTAFLGLTVRCARCHDHKFDPIPQKDYYALAAAFQAGFMAPGDGKLQGGPPPEAVGKPDVLAYTDRTANPPSTHLLIGGDPRREGPEVPAGFLSALPGPTAPPPVPRDPRATTGRRLRLAAWIADPANPLPARVAANRMWQRTFGEGLCSTPDNLGAKGGAPTHPELLDWLSIRLRTPESDGGFGWRLKPLHRMLVLSRAYRMASVHPRPAAGRRIDPTNRLWWKFPRRRLDADAVHDAILATNGALVRRPGGPGFTPTVTREALEGLSRKGAEWVPSPTEEQDRRSVYLFLKRALIPPLWTLFDFGDTTAPLARRDTTTVAPQALSLLNNPWVHAQADRLALRATSVAGSDTVQHVDAAWRLALGRSPTASERRAAVDWVRRFPRPDHALPEAGNPGAAAFPTDGLRLWLRADTGVVAENGWVLRWRDQSGNGFDALAGAETAPRHAGPTLQFDGTPRWLRIDAPVITSTAFTIVAAVSDAGGNGLREIFSNWNGRAGNSTTSVFLGASGDQLRFSDQFNPAGSPRNPNRRHVLTAISADSGATVWQGRRELARSGGPLVDRNLAPPWVIGQQGNIMGEYWKGEIAEILVWNRALSASEREAVWTELARRHPVDAIPAPPRRPDPGLASLCRILYNTNEFLTID